MKVEDELDFLLKEYKLENDKFLKSNYSASIRVRSILREVIRICETRRQEILEEREWIVSTYGEGDYVGEHARRMARKYGLKDGESFDWEN
jgi:hypothetical protein